MPEEFQPITSQDELDRILRPRLERERAKFADYDDLKKAAEAAEAEKNTLVEAKEAAEKAASELTSVADEAIKERDLLKLTHKVAHDHKVPADLLHGATEEELTASAKKLNEFRGPASPVVPDAESTPSDPPVDAKREFARTLFGRSDSN